jgi:AcrR family transcriptional regulator
MTSTREKLLDEAEILFAERGFYGTSINDVAAQLGLTKPGLLHHFPSKEKLYGAVLERASAFLMERLEDKLASAGSPEEQVYAIVDGFTGDDEQLVRVSRLLVRELLDNLERAEHSRRWYLAPLLQRVEGIIVDGQKAGHFRPLHPMAFIYQLIGAQQYFIISLSTLKGLHSAEAYREHLANHQAETHRIIRETLIAN